MDFNVVEFLKNETLNEMEKCKAFGDRLVEYCSKGHSVLSVFRILKGIELELRTCLKTAEEINVDKSTVERLLRIIGIELQIIKFRIRHPELTDESISGKFPIGKWTGNKIDLIELIYAISLVHSVGHGKVSIKDIKEGFEFIFGIDLGNIHDRLDDIASRKESRTRYLESLVDILNKFLDDMDA
jgi:hypothetical protein